VDGAPFEGQPLPQGRHEVRVSGPQFASETRRVDLAPRATLELTVEPAPRAETLLERDAERRRTLRLVAYVGAGAGLVSLAVASGLYVQNGSRWNRWDSKNELLRARFAEQNGTSLREVDALLDEENELRNRDMLALGLGVLGGALLAGSTALFLGSRPGAEHWVLTAGERAGIAYSGSF
jgi:hypothetical protein